MKGSSVMSSRLIDVLIAPLVSEKTSMRGEIENSVSFWVNPKATKLDIKRAVEHFFPGVVVEKVNTLIQPREHVRVGNRAGRKTKKKKAIIKLAEGHEIQFNE